MSTLNKILGRADANKDVGAGSAVNSGATATEGSGVQGAKNVAGSGVDADRGVHEFLNPEQVVKEHVRPVAPAVNGPDAVRNGGVGVDNVQGGASVNKAGAGTGGAVTGGASADADRGVHEFLNPEQVVKEHVRPVAPGARPAQGTAIQNGEGTGGANGGAVNGGGVNSGAADGVVERDAWPDEFKRRFPQVLDKNGNVDESKLRDLTASDYLGYLEKVKAQNADETDEERKKRLRREKWSRIYNGIGDMVSALSNLYFTTKGAPSVDQSNSLSKAYQARLDKLDAERERRHKELENAYRLVYATGTQLAKDKASEDYQRARSEAVRTKSLGEALRLNAQADLLEKQGKKAEADALRAQAVAAYYDVLKQGKSIDNKNKPQEYKDKHRVAQSTVERNAAQTNNANASADEHRRRGTKSWVSSSGGKGGKGGSKGGSSKGGYPWYDKNGGLHYAKQEGVAKQMAKQNGTYVDDYANNTSTDEFGTKKTSRTHSGWHSQKPVRTQGGGKGGGKGRFSGFSIHKKK